MHAGQIATRGCKWPDGATLIAWGFHPSTHAAGAVIRTAAKIEVFWTGVSFINLPPGWRTPEFFEIDPDTRCTCCGERFGDVDPQYFDPRDYTSSPYRADFYCSGDCESDGWQELEPIVRSEQREWDKARASTEGR